MPVQELYLSYITLDSVFYYNFIFIFILCFRYTSTEVVFSYISSDPPLFYCNFILIHYFIYIFSIFFRGSGNVAQHSLSVLRLTLFCLLPVHRHRLNSAFLSISFQHGTVNDAICSVFLKEFKCSTVNVSLSAIRPPSPPVFCQHGTVNDAVCNVFLKEFGVCVSPCHVYLFIHTTLSLAWFERPLACDRCR